jgi:hypothetical protein
MHVAVVSGCQHAGLSIENVYVRRPRRDGFCRDRELRVRSIGRQRSGDYDLALLRDRARRGDVAFDARAVAQEYGTSRPDVSRYDTGNSELDRGARADEAGGAPRAVADVGPLIRVNGEFTQILRDDCDGLLD